MKYGHILIGIFLCILLEFTLFQVNLRYHLWEPFFYYRHSESDEKRENNGVLTNPLLECLGMGENDHIRQLNISKFDIQDYVNKILAQNKVQFISVYVRDLNNGPWIGINEEENFIGGSLLKVPVLISYLKMAEDDSNLLNKKIEYKQKIVSNVQYFTPSYEIQVGKTYTVQELLNYMIDYSDNNAAELLFKNMKEGDLEATFESLGMGRPDPDSPYPVDAKTYAGFFRVLFNSSYLSKSKSELALNMLTKTDFNKGLTALIPPGITVAHKFGIRSDKDINQLHDCGIVYYPKHPYLVCIMSKGGNFDDLADTIANISKFIFDEVSTVDKK